MQYSPLKPKDILEVSDCVSPYYIVPKALTTDEDRASSLAYVFCVLFTLYVVFRHGIK